MRPWTWTLALDLTEQSHGALTFVRWLAQTARPGALRFCTVHVVQTEDDDGFDLPRATSDESIETCLRRFGLENIVEASVRLEGPSTPEVLHSWAKSGETDGLILGRASEGGASWTSLGRVGRCFARDLPIPTVIVPADYTAPRDAVGPVVVGLRDDEAASTVVGFADWMSGLLGAARVAVHAVPSPSYLPGGVYPPVNPRAYALHHDTRCAQAKDAVAEVVHAHASFDYELECSPGSSPVGVAEVAEQRDASMIVCEAKSEPRVEEVVLASVGPQVAAQSRMPTLLVPSDWPRTAVGTAAPTS